MPTNENWTVAEVQQQQNRCRSHRRASKMAFAAGKPPELIDGKALAHLIRAAQVAATVPLCPDCGKPMVWRTARKGRFAGGSFWGCSTYPACKGLRLAA